MAREVPAAEMSEAGVGRGTASSCIWNNNKISDIPALAFQEFPTSKMNGMFQPFSFRVKWSEPDMVFRKENGVWKTPSLAWPFVND